ncbi:MAG TPA: pyridoxal phosphate-dependent aminotransferase [Steroidobacteraceae bacterium]|nr:pyridoxal phosphate-dependent aminotransferase [Steroidobacteraceae bacterium]
MKWPAQRLHSQAAKGFGMYEVAARLQSSGVDVIHLEVGRPADDTPVHIKEAAKAALDAGIVHYGDLQGTLSLRQALADRYRAQQNLQVTAAEILITNGVTQGAFATFMAAIDPGDEVIVLEPWYPQHNSKIELVGGRVVTVSMQRVNGAYRLDPERVEAAITPRTRMIVLINPTNPTGTVYSALELHALARICIRHDLLVLSDEVYEYITFDGHRHISMATLPGMRERTITVSAFTKAYAMDGWRQGYVMAPAPLIADLRKVTMNDTTHPCVFAQEGARAAVVGPQQCLTEMVDRDRSRRDLAVGRLAAMPGVSCAVPQATIYAFPDIRSFGLTSNDLALAILERAHVAVESGSFYGPSGEGHLRVCFASEPYERVAEGMTRIAAFLSTLPRS